MLASVFTLSASAHASRFQALLSLLLVLGALCGASCSRAAKGATLAPLELAASPNPQAEASFREARAARAQGRATDASRLFRAFIRKWPGDPLVPFAKLELGRLALAAGRPRDARRWFEQVANTRDPSLAERGRMFAAIAAQRSGDDRAALRVLKPLVGRTVDPEETALLLESVARAEEAAGDALAALETRDRELASELGPEQRKRAEERVRAIVAGLDPTLQLPRAYELLPRDGYAWPVVAQRLLRVSFDLGERERVSAIAEELSDQDIPLDEELAALVLRAERSESADPGVIGAILPLSGRGREVGEAALHGLMLSAGEPGKPRVVYRDDAGDPARAVAALEDLVSLHRAIAIVGPLTAGPARAVIERAEELGVPVISLHPDSALTEGSSMAYRMLAEPAEEADALVRAAQRRGARRFVVLHPESPFGEAMHAAFREALRSRGATLVDSVSYPATTTSFVREAEALSKLSFDAVVLSDAPGKVALIAPALAARGMWSTAPGSAPPEGRSVLYVLPAASFAPSLANTARRYLQGALFSVLFDAADAPEFATRYRELFQAEPNLFSALGHDAYRLIEQALASGAATRAELAAALADVQLESAIATGRGFSATRGPKEPGQLKTLLGDSFVRAE